MSSAPSSDAFDAPAASRHPLISSVVRVADDSGSLYGSGVLVAPDVVITCAHVIAEIANRRLVLEPLADTRVTVSTAMLAWTSSASVTYIGEACVESEDVAVLKLEQPAPDAMEPATLVDGVRLDGNAVSIYGFPKGHDDGAWNHGRLGAATQNGLLQLSGRDGLPIQPGYSGAPIWDETEHAVVGIVVSRARDTAAAASFAIPAHRLAHACPRLALAEHRGRFSALTSLRARGQASEIEKFLDFYLGSESDPEAFAGRARETARLEGWLASTTPYGLLVAEAGKGKSALLARWALGLAASGRARVAFLPISIRFDTSLPSVAFRLLGERLRHLRHDADSPAPASPSAWAAEIHDAVLEARRPGEPPLLVVIDGMDELALRDTEEGLLFPLDPGGGVKVLLSARGPTDDPGQWLETLKWHGRAQTFDLSPLSRNDVRDVLRIAAPGFAHDDAIAEQLHRLSEGDPLLLRFYLEELDRQTHESDQQLRERLAARESGWRDFIEQWWRDQRRQWRQLGREVLAEERQTTDLLDLLATARGPITRSEIEKLAPLSLKDHRIIESRAHDLGRFIIATGHGGATRYVLAHPFLRAWFRDEMSQEQRREWDDRFLDYCLGAFARLLDGGDPHYVSAYVVQHLGAHLADSAEHAEQLHELICVAWRAAWQALGEGDDGFLADLEAAWRRAAAGTDARSVALQVRYALISSSVHTAAANLPPALIASLAEHGRWTRAAALACARRADAMNGNDDAVEHLARRFAELGHHRDAVRIASEITAPARRGALLAISVSAAAEAGHEQLAADAAEAIPDGAARARALTEIGEHIPAAAERILPRALATVDGLPAGAERDAAYEALTPLLTRLGVDELAARLTSISDPLLRSEVTVAVGGRFAARGELGAVAALIDCEQQPELYAWALATGAWRAGADHAATITDAALAAAERMPWGPQRTATLLELAAARPAVAEQARAAAIAGEPAIDGCRWIAAAGGERDLEVGDAHAMRAAIAARRPFVDSLKDFPLHERGERDDAAIRADIRVTIWTLLMLARTRADAPREALVELACKEIAALDGDPDAKAVGVVAAATTLAQAGLGPEAIAATAALGEQDRLLALAAMAADLASAGAIEHALRAYREAPSGCRPRISRCLPIASRRRVALRMHGRRPTESSTSASESRR